MLLIRADASSNQHGTPPGHGPETRGRINALKEKVAMWNYTSRRKGVSTGRDRRASALSTSVFHSLCFTMAQNNLASSARCIHGKISPQQGSRWLLLPSVKKLQPVTGCFRSLPSILWQETLRMALLTST